jgi:SAM-dependent methyltransferase
VYTHVLDGRRWEADVTGKAAEDRTSPSGAARYDGFADWYEGFNAPGVEANGEIIRELLGPGADPDAGAGPCLDLGCGTGMYFDLIRSTGRAPFGIDRSADQLRFARERGPAVQGDAAALPFADNVFSAVLMVWISTDVDDFAEVVREAVRVLRPGGRAMFLGAHPCFMGPHIEYREDGGRLIHPTYRLAAWHPVQPWWTGGAGLRNRVGMRHVPLAEFLHAFLDAGLVIERVVEPEPLRPVPGALALRLAKPGPR